MQNTHRTQPMEARHRTAADGHYLMFPLAMLPLAATHRLHGRISGRHKAATNLHTVSLAVEESAFL
jgi:hypothetical protein